MVIVGGCASQWDGVDPLLRSELRSLRRAMESGPSGDVLALEYSVEGHDGGWRWEVIVGDRLFAERRTKLSTQTSYAFGEDRHGPWFRVGDGPPREAPPEWRRLVRTRAALLRLAFLRPDDAEEAVYMPYDDERWEYVYRPSGGRTVTLLVDEESQRPIEWDVLDELGRLTACRDARWVVRHGRYVLGSTECRAINGDGDRAMRSAVRLAGAEAVAEAPHWARFAAAPEPRVCLAEATEIPIGDELRIDLPVEAGGATLPFALDSGAWHTYVDAEAARAMGVVPTGEVPIYIEPPWLPPGSSWIGVVDRMTVAGVPIDGARVLVMEDLAASGGTAGLLGADFFRRFVVDVDTPARTLRLVPHDRFEPDAESTAMFLHGTLGGSMRVTGEVLGVDRGALVLDTGAAVRVVVHSPRMAAVHPRHPGSEVGRFYGDMARSPDYAAEIAGLHLGPFAFPSMPAWGRDRDRERIGGGIGLVGMGTMRHLRMSFDARNRTVYVSAGPSYQALARAGVELEDDVQGGAFVSHVVPHGAAWSGGIAVGDTIVAVDGVRVRDAAEGRALIAGHHGAAARFSVLRMDRRRQTTVALDLPSDTVNELAGPPTRSGLSIPICREPARPHALR